MNRCSVRRVAGRVGLVLMLAGVFLIGWGAKTVSQDLSVGFKTAPTGHGRVDVVSFVQMPDSEKYEMAWRTEVSRRYSDAVMVICHGTDFDNKWCAAPMMQGQFIGLFPMDKFIGAVKQKYPGRLIVMITCNPGHYRLKIPGVVYALDNVWIMTDVSARPLQAIGVGNIFEFEESK